MLRFWVVVPNADSTASVVRIIWDFISTYKALTVQQCREGKNRQKRRINVPTTLGARAEYGHSVVGMGGVNSSRMLLVVGDPVICISCLHKPDHSRMNYKWRY